MMMAAAFPRSRVRRLRHLALRARPRRVRDGSTSGLTTSASSIRATNRLPDDGSVRVRHHVRLHPRHDRSAVGMMHVIRARARRRRHVAARRHQGPGHLRRERRQEPDGAADVRHQRAVVHVVGDVVARTVPVSARSGCRRAGPQEMAAEAGFARLPPARHRARDQRVLRDPTSDRPRWPRHDHDRVATIDDADDTTDARLSAAVPFDRRARGDRDRRGERHGPGHRVPVRRRGRTGRGRRPRRRAGGRGRRRDRRRARPGFGARRRVRRGRTRRSCTPLVERTVEWAGRLDIVVNNAGDLADQLGVPGRGRVRDATGRARST